MKDASVGVGIRLPLDLPSVTPHTYRGCREQAEISGNYDPSCFWSSDRRWRHPTILNWKFLCPSNRVSVYQNLACMNWLTGPLTMELSLYYLRIAWPRKDLGMGYNCDGYSSFITCRSWSRLVRGRNCLVRSAISRDSISVVGAEAVTLEACWNHSRPLSLLVVDALCMK